MGSGYDQNDLEEDDELMKAAEHAGQLASLLAASQEEESNYEALERRVARWEDFRSHLMRESEKALSHNPSGIGTGGWLYHYTLPSWRGLKLLGFEEGSGLDNDDEVFDALEVARKEIQEEKKRIAEVRRLREIAKQKRLAEERHRREEQRRLCWMRETEEKRRLVQQHMADLKRQRALEAEIKQMAREEALALALMREEKRLAKHRLAKEAALAEERRSKELAAEAKPAELAQAQCLQNAEISAKEREDERSRQLEAEKWAAEMASREREAYLQELYTPFTPLWGWMWNTLSSEDGEDQFGEGSEDGGGGGSRPTAWWQGADVPQIWEGPRTPYRSTSKQRERPRLTPNADTDIDGLNIQAVSVGKMTREVLTLLGLPRESVRDMYEQGKRTVRDTDAVVESIQLGRIFTMFEDDQVRNNLIPAVPLERLETRVINKISGKRQTAPRQYHRQAIVPGENFFRRSHGRRLSSHGVPLLTALDGRSPRNNWGGIRTSGSHRSLREGGEGCATLLEKEWGRNIEGFGDDYVAGLTLSGDKATLSETDSQERMHGRRAGSMSMPIAKNLGPEIKPSLSAMSLKAITKQKPGLTPTVSVSCKTSGETQNYPRAPLQSSSSSKRIGASSRKELLPLSSQQQRRGLGWTGSRKKSFSRKKTQSI